jgi:hypothetical protein
MPVYCAHIMLWVEAAVAGLGQVLLNFPVHGHRHNGPSPLLIARYPYILMCVFGKDG